MTLRHPNVEAAYQLYRETHMGEPCIFCVRHRATARKVLPQWYLSDNEFPYANAKKHWLLFPDVHGFTTLITSGSLMGEVMRMVERRNVPAHDTLMFHHPTTSSVPGHFHVHLIVWDI